MRVCSCCGKEKEDKNFLKTKPEDGRCETCRYSLKRKEFKQKNKEKIRLYFAKHRKENKEKIIEYQRNYYEKNKIKKNEYSKNYYQKNKDKVRQKVNEYLAKNREQVSEKNKLRYIKNIEKNREKKRGYINSAPIFYVAKNQKLTKEFALENKDLILAYRELLLLKRLINEKRTGTQG